MLGFGRPLAARTPRARADSNLGRENCSPEAVSADVVSGWFSDAAAVAAADRLLDLPFVPPPFLPPPPREAAREREDMAALLGLG